MVTNSEIQLSLFTAETQQSIIQGDCLDIMRTMQNNSIDFIVTDPPYGLHFMGKDWDKFKQSNYDLSPVKQVMSIDGYSRVARSFNCGNTESGTYDPKRDDEFQEFMRQFGIEALRILKPGSHLAMFGSPRRHHRQMSGLEDAGFEIRDCIAWIFGQGFPKSHNFGNKMNEDWKGYGTALKPAYEPIIIAMRPLDGTFAQNADKWGVAGINIDESRVVTNEYIFSHSNGSRNAYDGNSLHTAKTRTDGHQTEGQKLGRWPANIILDEESAKELDEMTGISSSPLGNIKGTKSSGGILNRTEGNRMSNSGHGDSGGASRFFYCAKASSSERNRGLEGMPLKSGGSNAKDFTEDVAKGLERNKPVANFHPTVKPVALMKYILKLLAPPGNPICLDPFAGSGSTLVAAKELGINCIGIEKEYEYCEIARKRINSNYFT